MNKLILYLCLFTSLLFGCTTITPIKKYDVDFVTVNVDENMAEEIVDYLNEGDITFKDYYKWCETQILRYWQDDPKHIYLHILSGFLEWIEGG